MSVQEIKSQLTGDKYYKVKHKSGLNIYVYEKRATTVPMQFLVQDMAQSTQISAQMVVRK